MLTLDLHAAQIQGFFDIPVDHSIRAPLLANHFLENNFKDKDIVVVSPDHGGVTRARKMAEFLHALSRLWINVVQKQTWQNCEYHRGSQRKSCRINRRYD